MAVVFATFMISMIPRAAVAAERILDVLDTRPSVVPPATPVHEHARRPVRVEFRDAGLPLPGGGARGARRRVGPGAPAARRLAIIGSTGAGKTTLVALVARLMDATEGDGAGRRGRRPRARSRRCCGGRSATCRSARSSSAAPLRRTSASPGPTPPTTSSGTRSSRPGVEFRAGAPRRAREPDHPGRQQPVGRPASTTRDRSGARRATAHLSCSTIPSPRSTSPPRPARLRSSRTPGTPRCSSSPSGSPRSSTPTRSSSSKTARWSVSGRHDDLLLTCPIYAEIDASQRGQVGAA